MESFRIQNCVGDWALVTGASTGIGREYARQLARLGIHVVIVARQKHLLDSLAEEITATGQARAVPIELDLAAPGAAPELLTRLGSLGPLRMRLVVNNAGCGAWGAFDATLAERYQNIVALNNAGLVSITAALLPWLQQCTPSALINVSSQAAYQPVPYMAIYAASKAFVHSFSQALHEELFPKGVLVQTLVPGPTATEFDRLAGAYTSSLTVRGSTTDVVAASLAGLERGAIIASNAKGLWKQRLFAGLFPPRAVVREVAKLFRPPTSKGPQ